MEATAEAASAASPGSHTARTTADTAQSVAPTRAVVPRTGAAPSAEMDMSDDSMPVPDVAPMTRLTRLQLAIRGVANAVRPDASGTTQGTAEGTATWTANPAVTVQLDYDWDDEYDESTDEERDDSGHVFFGADGGDDTGDGTTGDDDDTSQHDDESGDDYEARLNGMIPSSERFCCRPVFF